MRRGLVKTVEHPLLADARAMGATASALERLRARIEADEGLDRPVPVWSAHWHAFQVFRGMATQWRVSRPARGVEVFEGLDYAGLPVVLQEHRRMPRRYRQPLERLMPQLRVLEAAARTEFNRPEG